ncbi:folylpolyglutamate synthase, mitochondrial-like [Diadema setosum]|uniref:folylpolyglutamate synthase, mitochondrial-like n=1 Tax=Diadema setosum TaxID=31175 RepID=UPI003B3A058A
MTAHRRNCQSHFKNFLVSWQSSAAGMDILASDHPNHDFQGDEDESIYQTFLESLGKLICSSGTYLPDRRHDKISDGRKFLERAGLTKEVLNSLSCIHVAGTKGKGSTCALTERILRTCGYKTGLLTSPPLVEVRERIRVGGAALPRAKFARYGIDFLKMIQTNTHINEKDPVFAREIGPYQLLVLLTFYIFLQEKVDVAVIEVGMGGEYDTTNVIWSPTVTGVTSLGIDHVNYLGHTIEEIAWHKSGIFKNGRPAFTVAQDAGAMQVLVRRAAEKGVTLRVCLPIEHNDFRGNPLKVGLVGKHQLINATLAVQMAKAWIEEKDPGRFYFQVPEHPVDPDSVTGLIDPTGEQQLTYGEVEKAMPFTLPSEFIRGSAFMCRDWFAEVAERDAEVMGGVVKRVLMFYLGGDRQVHDIMAPFVECNFDAVVICGSRSVSDKENEVRDFKQSPLKLPALLKKLTTLADAYRDLHKKMKSESTPPSNNGKIGIPIIQVAPSATEALQWAVGPLDDKYCPLNGGVMQNQEISPFAERGVPQSADHLQILVTGSTYLVGSVLKVLDPTLATVIVNFRAAILTGTQSEDSRKNNSPSPEEDLYD